MSLPQRDYVITVHEITEDGMELATAHVVRDVDPWCAVRRWAEQMEIEESE